DVVEEAADALVNLLVVERFEPGIAKPAKLEERREAIGDLGERRLGLRWAAPGEVDHHAAVGHAGERTWGAAALLGRLAQFGVSGTVGASPHSGRRRQDAGRAVVSLDIACA